MKNTLGVAFIGLLFSCGLSAATISYSHITSVQSIPFTDTFSLPGFSTSLGTLSGVTIALQNSTTASLIVYNFSQLPQNFSNGTASVPETLRTVSGSLSSTANAGPFSGTAPSGISTLPGLSASSTTVLSPANVLLFESNGGTSLSFALSSESASFSGTTTAPGAEVYFGGSALAGSTTTIDYTYAAAPISPAAEPASLSLVTGTLIGVLALYLRRSTRSKSLVGAIQKEKAISSEQSAYPRILGFQKSEQTLG